MFHSIPTPGHHGHAYSHTLPAGEVVSQKGQAVEEKNMTVIRRRVKNFGRRIVARVSRLIWPPVPRNENPWATHLPVLVALARCLSVRRVLEFGAGTYSTPAFLDRAAFPNLVKLRSIEDDAEWCETVRKRVHDDPRFELDLVSTPMSGNVATAMSDTYDLIFIDDSQVVDDRARTIREVTLRCDPRSIVVIHDYEVEAYRRASESMTHRFRVSAVDPNVGICWNAAPLKRRSLRALNALLRRNSGKIPVDDVGRWVALLDAEPLST